jgi:hypothetical protein
LTTHADVFQILFELVFFVAFGRTTEEIVEGKNSNFHQPCFVPLFSEPDLRRARTHTPPKQQSQSDPFISQHFFTHRC